jgi:hypothetical protein
VRGDARVGYERLLLDHLTRENSRRRGDRANLRLDHVAVVNSHKIKPGFNLSERKQPSPHTTHAASTDSGPTSNVVNRMKMRLYGGTGRIIH